MTDIAFTRQARKQVLFAESWWRENRRSAESLFRDELDKTVRLLASFPAIGRPVAPGFRRWPLVKSKYHVYYVYEQDTDTVMIVAVWGAQRHDMPPMDYP